MKVNLLLILFLFLYQSSFSQTEKSLKGILLSGNFLLKNVEVINKTSQKNTTTNDKGEFIIAVKANDSLLFYAKNYYLKRIKLTSDQIDQNNLQIVMIKKPEELEEVVITKIDPIKWKKDTKWEQDKRDEVHLNRASKVLKTDVYDGAIENGADIFRIGGMILGLFIKDKEPPKEKAPEVEFAVLAKNTCDQKFYLEKLKLKPEEIDLFLQFCDADPKSKKLIENSNVLSMMDFLSAKNGEFNNLTQQMINFIFVEL